MFIYVVSTPLFAALKWAKIGFTNSPRSRIHNFRTAMPPMDARMRHGYINLWRVAGGTEPEARVAERALHDYFVAARCQWEREGDSEWFLFSRMGFETIEAFAAAVGARAVSLGHTPVEIDEALAHRPCPVARELIDLMQAAAPVPAPLNARLIQDYDHNAARFMRDPTERTRRLTASQNEIVAAAAEFYVGNQRGYLQLPCGYGKTRIAARVVVGDSAHPRYPHVIVCAPSLHLRNAWAAELRAYGRHAVITVETGRVAPPAQPTAFVTTYASAHLLLPVVDNADELVDAMTRLDIGGAPAAPPRRWFIILDEVHHMAGVAPTPDVAGPGKTRAMFQRAARVGARVLGLTFTPKMVDAPDGLAVMSMDDEELFGRAIYSMNLRQPVEAGILPDYRIWPLYCPGDAALAARVDAMCEAWHAVEPVDDVHVPIFNKLLLYTRDLADAREACRMIRERLPALPVAVVDGTHGDDERGRILRAFDMAPRAILINCKLFNEGFSMDCIDAVGLLCDKNSYIELVQNLLRAGRYLPTKPVFHMLVPFGADSTAVIANVLVALARVDSRLAAEVSLRLAHGGAALDPRMVVGAGGIDADAYADATRIIQMERLAGGDVDAIRAMFVGVCNVVATGMSRAEVVDLCASHHVDSSAMYAAMCHLIPRLPADPRPRGVTWYDFFHPGDAPRVSVAEFLTLTANKSFTTVTYDTWRDAHAPALPSYTHICDGYFGDININTLFQPTLTGRR